LGINEKVEKMKKVNVWAKFLTLLTIIVVLAGCQSAPAQTPTPTVIPSPKVSSPSPTVTSAPVTPQPTLTSATPITTPTTAPATAPGVNVTIDLIAQGFAFDKKTISVPAGATVLIHFNNKDSAPHNFALYQDNTAAKSIFIGNVVTSSTTDYKFTAPTAPGTYFFRCDFHPSVMTGSFIVQ
jgi:plastocyanin